MLCQLWATQICHARLGTAGPPVGPLQKALGLLGMQEAALLCPAEVLFLPTALASLYACNYIASTQVPPFLLYSPVHTVARGSPRKRRAAAARTITECSSQISWVGKAASAPCPPLPINARCVNSCFSSSSFIP